MNGLILLSVDRCSLTGKSLFTSLFTISPANGQETTDNATPKSLTYSDEKIAFIF